MFVFATMTTRRHHEWETRDLDAGVAAARARAHPCKRAPG